VKRPSREDTIWKGGLPVIHHVLVPTDGSENAERAVRFSAQVADRRQQAEVTVVFVHLLVTPSSSVGVLTPAPEQLLTDLSDEEQVRAQEIVDRAVAVVRSLVTSPDVEVSGRIVIGNRVDDGILQVAEEINADIIVVGTRGLSPLRGAIMGSVSHSLIEKARCPVLVVK
jgi:nucleotide-binding universal stress UspA family protein